MRALLANFGMTPADVLLDPAPYLVFHRGKWYLIHHRLTRSGGHAIACRPLVPGGSRIGEIRGALRSAKRRERSAA